MITNNNSISKKFIKENYSNLNEVGIGGALTAANNIIGANANLLTFAPMALPGIGLVIGGVTQKLTQLKWKLQGCAKEIDPNRKIECEMRERNKLIASLTQDRKKCRQTKDPAKCIDSVDQKIHMLKSKNAQAYG